MTQDVAQLQSGKKHAREMSQDPDDIGFYERLMALIGTEKPYKFASRCQISRNSMKTFLERGTIMTGKNLILVKKATGVSLDWLLLGEGPTYTSRALGSVARIADEAPMTYLPQRVACAPTWLEPVWAAYKRLVKPIHVRWARNSVLAYQALATEFPHLNLSHSELENLMAMLNKLADDIPEEAPISLAMIRAWLLQLEEQGTRMSKESDK